MLEAYAPRAARLYTVAGMLVRPGLCMLYGRPGGLKSMLAMDLALHVASGTPWLPDKSGGQSPVTRPTTQGGVIWADLDMGRDEVLDRMAALGKGMGLAPDVPLAVVSLPDPSFDGNDPRSWTYLQQAVKDLGATQVVIDNFNAALCGIDENTSDVAPVMAKAKAFTKDTGTNLLFVHHPTKGNARGGNPGDTLRGHGSILAKLDLSLLVTRERDEDRVHVVATKTRGAPVKAFDAEWFHTTKADGLTLEVAQFFGSGSTYTGAVVALDKLICKIVGVVPGITQRDLVAQVQQQAPQGATYTGQQFVKDRIAILVANAEIEDKRGGAGNAHRYYPASPFSAAMGGNP